MSFFYKSERVGKGGRVFFMYKIRTLKDGTDKQSSFAMEDAYTFGGRFLRKLHFDEIPQLWNVLNGDMNLFGYRPDEPRGFALLPEHMQEYLKKHKPGLLDLASLHFFNEERILQLSKDPHKTYWENIRPMKYTLQVFFIENKSVLLRLAILWIGFKKVLGSLLRK